MKLESIQVEQKFFLKAGKSGSKLISLNFFPQISMSFVLSWPMYSYSGLNSCHSTTVSAVDKELFTFYIIFWYDF